MTLRGHELWACQCKIAYQAKGQGIRARSTENCNETTGCQDRCLGLLDRTKHLNYIQVY